MAAKISHLFWSLYHIALIAFSSVNYVLHRSRELSLVQGLSCTHCSNSFCRHHVICTTSTDLKGAWIFVKNDAACDTSAGEVKLKDSPGKSPNLEACQRSCEAAADCQSITFSNAGLCSHFSTACSKTEHINGAISLRLSSVSDSNLSPDHPRHTGEVRLSEFGQSLTNGARHTYSHTYKVIVRV